MNGRTKGCKCGRIRKGRSLDVAPYWKDAETWKANQWLYKSHEQLCNTASALETIHLNQVGGQ